MNYLLIMLGILIIPLIAQLYVSASYSKYKKMKNTNEMTGFEVARKILDKNGLKDIHIVETRGNLSDHYDPSRKVVRLSPEIFNGDSIAATAVAAHEVGHALQDKNKYFFIKLRNLIFPIVHFTSKFAYIVILIGFFAELTELVELGIIFVSFGVFFQLITLPVEFNASKRAKEEIKSLKLSRSDKIIEVNSMLTAAALTYVAGLIASILELLRLIMILRGRD